MQPLFQIPTQMELTNRKLNSHFLKEQSLTDRSSYEYYRQNRKAPSKTIDQYNYFVKAVEGVFNVIQDLIINSEEGVYVKDIGYFCAQKKRKKKRVKTSLFKKGFNYSTVTFIPDENLKGWIMEGTVEVQIKNLISEADIDYNLNIPLYESVRYQEESIQKEYKKRKRVSKNAFNRIY